MNRKLRVFLCHASQDKSFAYELYRRLLMEGWIDPWLDEEKLLPGQDWDMEIEQALEESDAIIFCLSSTAVSKEGYVQKEMKIALNYSLYKPNDAIFIVPLRLDDCKIPISLKQYQYVDFFPHERKEPAYSRLMKSLTKRFEQIMGHNNKSKTQPVYKTSRAQTQDEQTSSKMRITILITAFAIIISLSSFGAWVLDKMNFNVSSEETLSTQTLPSLTSIAQGSQAATLDLSTTPSVSATQEIVPLLSATPMLNQTLTPTPQLSYEKLISPENISDIQVIYSSDLEMNSDIKFSPDGKQVIIGGTGATYGAKTWEFRSGIFRDLPSGFFPVSFSPNGVYIAVGRGSGDGNQLSTIAKIYRNLDFSEVSLLNGYQAYITQAKFFSDNQRLATSSLDNKVIIWDFQSGSILNEFTFDSQIYDFDIDSTGKYLVATGFLSAQKVYLVDVESGSFLGDFSGNNGTTMAVQFSPDGSIIAAGDGLNTDSPNIYLWRTIDGALLHTISVPKFGISQLIFSPNGEIMASLRSDGIDFWNTINGQKISSFEMEGIAKIAFDPTGYYLAVANTFPNKGVLILGIPK